MQFDISKDELKELIKECVREVINEPKKIKKDKSVKSDIVKLSPNDILSINILGYLNYRCDKSFTIDNVTHLQWIKARIFMDKDISPNQAIGIINQKADEWIEDDNMNKYLRPSTLFNKTKCNEYLGNLKQFYRYKTQDAAMQCTLLLQSHILSEEEYETLKVTKNSINNNRGNDGEFL